MLQRARPIGPAATHEQYRCSCQHKSRTKAVPHRIFLVPIRYAPIMSTTLDPLRKPHHPLTHKRRAYAHAHTCARPVPPVRIHRQRDPHWCRYACPQPPPVYIARKIHIGAAMRPPATTRARRAHARARARGYLWARALGAQRVVAQVVV